MKKKLLTLGAALTLLLALTACSGETVTPERTVSGTMLLDGTETSVYLKVSGTGISFWDCDYTDLDEDGNGDLTAAFAFADGTTASLVWFYVDGGFVYNEEFSLLPGNAPAAGNKE